MSDDKAQATGKSERFPLEISRRLSLLLPAHLELLVEAARVQRYLFTGRESSARAPLWMRLLRREGGGLRQVSGDWLKASDALVSKVGMAPSTEALAAGDPPQADVGYRLGLFDLVRTALRDRSDSAAQVLRLRIAIVSGGVDGDARALISSLGADESTERGLLALHLVLSAKRGRSPDDAAEKELESWAEEGAASAHHGSPAVLCHAANSLNFLWSKRGETGRVEAMLDVVEKGLAPRIESPELRDHVLGNASFHRAILSRRTAKPDEELACLAAAARLDYGFTDYDYRIAQILHDRADDKARVHYEAALRTGPFNEALVNDYGCFLNEHGAAGELKSWESLASFLFAGQAAPA